ncbi:helix-turn-helix transcriptional regulator [Nocardia cyriacigeorgica]|uniref:helix-turn-helix transcriptional regulator n=1 Tax=Nocardia cyriacigeorgica TaxID=135487 RepID=UPI0006623EA0|nr:LuxR family transcriptional regulator [Nocardia cyriacigeorgica]BDT87362.1 LuxR family transcriptional regulator [Nocardia cyriacigeorgica]
MVVSSVPGSSGAPGSDALWPLTGRVEEVRAAEAAIRAGGLVISGAAGIGKTRLASSLFHQAGSRWQPAWFAATESSRSIALGVFGAVASEAALGVDTLDRTQRLVSALSVAPVGRRALICIDDAHLLDDVSAFVVHQLVTRQLASVVLTVRSHTACPASVTALWKERILDRIELQPLSADETRHLLVTALGGHIESTTFRRLWDITRGNTLFLRQLTDDERAAGRLHRVGSVWVWEGQPAVSPGLGELIAQRMGRLDSALRDVVDALALAEPIEAGVLSQLTSASAIEEAENQRIVEVDTESGRCLVRLAHPLFGEARRAAAGEMRLRTLRGRLADALARAGDTDPRTAVQRAMLELDSDRRPEPVLLTVAARAAMHLLDLATAERLAHEASIAGGDPVTQLTYALVLVLLGRGADSEAVLERLASAEPATVRVHAATVRAANLVWMLGDPARAETVLRANEPDAALNGLHAAHQAIAACVHVVQGRPRRGAEFAATALADPGLPPFHAVMASAAHVQGLGAIGDISGMESAAARGQALARQSPETSHLRFWFGALQARAYRLAGRLDRDQETVQHLREQAEHAPPGIASAQITLLLGHSALACGRLGDAVRWLEDTRAGIDIYPESSGLRAAVMLWLAEAHAASGHHDAAAAALANLKVAMPAQYTFMRTAASMSAAWTLAAEGAVTEAVAAVHEAAAGAQSRGEHANEVLCWQTATQFGDPSGADRLATLTGIVQGPRADVAAEHAAALARRDASAVEQAAIRYRNMGDMVAAADATAQAGTLYAASGRNGHAQLAITEAHRLASACATADTPALRSAFQPVTLTNREREIIHLVAEGMTSRKIAERLHLSARTVEGHLYRAAQKTGVTNREELVAFLLGRTGA